MPLIDSLLTRSSVHGISILWHIHFMYLPYAFCPHAHIYSPFLSCTHTVHSCLASSPFLDIPISPFYLFRVLSSGTDAPAPASVMYVHAARDVRLEQKLSPSFYTEKSILQSNNLFTEKLRISMNELVSKCV